jgi:quercetin dioxygenase-like cupin family protein
MQTINIFEKGPFKDEKYGMLWVHDSPHIRVVNFNFRAGQELPIHHHDMEGELSLVVLMGEGDFLADEGVTMPAKPGDVLVCPIRVPHGLRATTDMRILVTVSPPPQINIPRE